MINANGLWPLVLFCPECATEDCGSAAMVVLVPSTVSKQPTALPTRYCFTHPDVRMWATRSDVFLSVSGAIIPTPPTEAP